MELAGAGGFGFHFHFSLLLSFHSLTVGPSAGIILSGRGDEMNSGGRGSALPSLARYHTLVYFVLFWREIPHVMLTARERSGLLIYIRVASSLITIISYIGE